MISILLGFAALALVAFLGIFIALMREYGTTVPETFHSILEAIQDIKAHKASNRVKGS